MRRSRPYKTIFLRYPWTMERFREVIDELLAISFEYWCSSKANVAHWNLYGSKKEISFFIICLNRLGIRYGKRHRLKKYASYTHITLFKKDFVRAQIANK